MPIGYRGRLNPPWASLASLAAILERICTMSEQQPQQQLDPEPSASRPRGSNLTPSKLKLALARLARLGYLVEKAGQQQLRVKVPGINRPVFLTEHQSALVEWAERTPSAAELAARLKR